jgi:hypothetical protein
MGGGGSKISTGRDDNLVKKAEIRVLSGSEGALYYQTGDTQGNIFLPHESASSDTFVVIQQPDAKDIFIVSSKSIN